ASGASPEMMMERHREQVEKEEAPTGATALLGTPQSSASKLGRLETDNEAGVSESAKSGEDAWQYKKDMPLQQQALILNQQVQAENNYISRAELAELLNNTILLAQQMGKEFTVLRKEAVKNRDLKKSDSYINGLKPLMTMKVVADNAYIMPDLEWFFSRSQPGTVEYSFFSLARSGWCVAAGSCTIGKIDRPEAQKLRIRWQTLEPQLTGIFKQIADYTIEHLDSQ
ncbi:MAG TPA: hypothetical protein VK186_06385, partial [Candidatus Deferrimicrobium sp.]|nr:hypothetical protein [Candidatus Deferrimicrobium sp.]